MKIKPAVLVGVLFVALFVIVAYVFQAFGYWNPPGVESTYESDHDDHDETEVESEYVELGYISDLLEGSMNLHDFLEDYDVDISCVSGKLGIANSEIKKDARDIKDKLGIDMSDIRAIIDECMGLEARPDPHSVETETTETEHEPETDEVESVIVDEGLVYVSDELVGSDNLMEFLKNNDIPADCLAEKLGIGEKELDQSAKDIKEELVIDMTDIRFAIDDCLGLPQREDPHTVTDETEVEESESIDKAIEEEPKEEDEDVGLDDSDTHQAASDLPQLMGKDNIKSYCEENSIPVDCVASKLNLDVKALDMQGGKLSREIGMDMSALRDLVSSCCL